MLPGLDASAGITPAPPGPWGAFLALSLAFLICQMGATQQGRVRTQIRMEGVLRGGELAGAAGRALTFWGDCRSCQAVGGSRASLPTPSLPQVPLDERIIFSGNLFQYQEDNKKWRNRFSLVPHNYGLVLYENKVVRPHPGSSRAQPGPCFPPPRQPSCSMPVITACPPLLNPRLQAPILSLPPSIPPWLPPGPQQNVSSPLLPTPACSAGCPL